MIKTKPLNDYKVKKITLPKLPDNKKIRGSKLFPLYSNIFICAKKNSGKTTVIANILKECVDDDTTVNIFCSTLEKDRSYKEIIKFLEKKGCNVIGSVSSVADDGKNCLIQEILNEPVVNDEEQDEEEDEEIEDTYIKITNNNDTKDSNEMTSELKNDHKKRKKSKLAQKRIIILDDIGSELTRPVINQLLKVNRHLKCKVIISTQYLNDLSPQARRQIDQWLIFPGMKSDKLTQILRDSDVPYDLPHFEKLYNYCTKDKYNFMYLDTSNGSIRKNFNESVILQ